MCAIVLVVIMVLIAKHTIATVLYLILHKFALVEEIVQHLTSVHVQQVGLVMHVRHLLALELVVWMQQFAMVMVHAPRTITALVKVDIMEIHAQIMIVLELIPYQESMQSLMIQRAHYGAPQQESYGLVALIQVLIQNGFLGLVLDQQKLDGYLVRLLRPTLK